MTQLHVSAALLGPEYETSGPVRISIKDGRIAAISPASKPDGPARLAMPALADAHNHARPLSTTSFGCGGKPLEQWLPQLAVMPPVDAYTATAASLARSVRGGATGVMVHLTRAMGLKPLPDEARDIARAAADVGVSIGFAISMRDRNPLIYGDHEALLGELAPEVAQLARNTWLKPLPSVAEQLALVDQVASALADEPHVDVQYGPTGVQWCSDEMLRAIADASARTKRRIHMHLLETQPQRQWLDQTYPQGGVSFLEEIGFLSSRLTLAHCVWAREQELDLIAASGARIAVSNSSNLHLYSGRAPLADMQAAGVAVAMGLDGCALDEDDDGLRELRLFHLLGRRPGYPSDQGMTHAAALRAACRTGRAALGLPEGGVLEVGMPADLLILDLDALDRDALMPVSAEDLLFARATAAHVVEVWTSGRQVVREGHVQGVDLAQLEKSLRGAYRSGLVGTEKLQELWPTVEQNIGDYYRGCC
ncbi:amidohydrolase family protein [Marivita sp. XM-24bin2]|uniref:amidohydrolase family protein n=1 Tax=Marivita sp. XM-24bin2 TaxID=2133951 RepID=UPI000D7AF857|nr:amidohydrolase family protein [Marivita sp. XM-24bin2]PWL33607.1 MAG: cytosine deaminase [Marivita sp. XM-24bin2]